MVQRRQRVLPIAVALACALLLSSAASALAAPPTLTPSVVGEAPTGGGVFRFPQAVAIDPHDGGVVVGDQYSGRIQVFSPTGQHRFTFGALGSRAEKGRMNVVGGVAVDRSRHIYVLDSDHDRVQVFSARTGAFITTFGDSSVMNLFAGPTRADHGITASGIAVFQASPTAAPIVYVADSGNSRVEAFTLDPRTLQPVGAPRINTGTQLQWPQGVTTDRSGKRVYVADNQHHRVVVLDAVTMASTGTVGINGTGPGQFNAPYDVAIDGGNPSRLYVADNLNGRVNIFDAGNLGFLGTLGGNGHRVGLFSIVRAIASNPRDKTGGITVADTANNRIQRVDRDGNVIAAWGIAGRSQGYVTRARGVAFGPEGSIAVGDTFDHRIELFASDGTYIGQHGPLSRTGFAAPADSPTRFLLPETVAYDKDGYLWVSDSGNDRVKRISPSGETVLVTPEATVIRPRGIAVAPDGSAYVADSGQNALLKIDVDGSVGVARSDLKAPFGAAWGGPGATPSVWVATSTNIVDALGTARIDPPFGAKTWERPDSLVFAPDGTLYVSESRPKVENGARVLRGTPDGNGGYGWDVVATEGAGPGQVIDPAGLAVSADGGTLLVADSGNNRVLRFDAPGNGPGPRHELVTAIVGGATRGAITSPVGIDCQTDCSQHIGPGRQVTLTVTTFDGSIFQGWTGACAAAGTAPTCTVTMNGDQFAAARFTAVPPPPVKITAVKASPTRWHRPRPATKKPRRAAEKATKAQLTVSMTQPASVQMAVLVAKPGQLAAGVCRATTKKTVKKSLRCTRYAKRKGTRTLRMTAGNTVIATTTSFGGKTLAPGLYRFSFTARDAQGNVSTKTSPRIMVTR